MRINILIIHRDDIDKDTIPQPEEYYNYICVSKSLFAVDAYKLFSLLWVKNKIKLFYSIGGPVAEWMEVFGKFPYEVRKFWIHYEKIDAFETDSHSYCLVDNRLPRENNAYPLISVLTTTFHSGEKLKRPHESLLSQTYNNWEWVIWDDSKDDKTWIELQQLAMTDLRIKIYKTQHSGYIGEMKYRSGSLCQGEWIVELDHDDRISPELFQTVVTVAKKYPKCGFIYSDFYQLDEETNASCIFNSGFAAFGYGWYFKEWVRDKFQNVYYTQSVNPLTISHIVGVPNHVRIWKRAVYEELDKHCDFLPVADDYELLLRTFLHNCDWVRIPKALYVQYNNAARNNFTYIRNALIQHLSDAIWDVYETPVYKKFVALGYNIDAYAEEVNWLQGGPDYKRYEITHCVEDLSLILIVPKDISKNCLQKCLTLIYNQKMPFVVFIVGHPKSGGEQVVREWVNLHPDSLQNLRFWFFTKADGSIHGPEDIWSDKRYQHHLLNYGLKIGVRTKLVTYLNPTFTIDWDNYQLPQLVEKIGEDAWYVAKNNTINGFIHKTELLQQHGYWEERIDPNLMIKKWE